MHFIRSSVNFGKALPEQVSFSSRTKALRDNQRVSKLLIKFVLIKLTSLSV